MSPDTARPPAAAVEGALFHAPLAWLEGRWQRDVLLHAGPDGHWLDVRAGLPAPVAAQRLAGPVLPSLVNAHSHAFQRAFAGMAEQRVKDSDDFWTWRERMYGVALRITPEQLRAVAAQLYTELLAGGYTQVCEFHYLHHREDGQPYEDELAMSWALAEAAREVGIGLTLLPVLYAHAGFGQTGLRETQRRFRTDAGWVWQACQRINAAGWPLVSAGVALHSLRAAHPQDIAELQRLVAGTAVPIHIHVAEQQQEVKDCLATTGQRPLAAVAGYGLDPRWQLVHATHSTRGEIDRIAASGAGVVICPGTEANLGDGLADLQGWLDAGVPITVGSDSQVTRGWVEELRWLEYGQRLGQQRRNVAAAPGHQPSTAARLFDACLRGSAGAAGLGAWGLVRGARADFLVLDEAACGLAGLPSACLMDGLVFASQGHPWQAVYVAGQQRPMQDTARQRRHAAVMRACWGEPGAAGAAGVPG